ncbi:superfamily II DNA helicase RecQ [Lachnospiraceae bacterium PF1-21]
MALFGNKEPIFLKRESDLPRLIESLKELRGTLDSEGSRILEQDIKNYEYGLAGEENIVFELSNSHMPMYILRDIYICQDNLSAQIDFVVVTAKQVYIIECKNLYGNVEIDNAGNFTRTMEYGGRKKKEGLYSPITQNQRHMELLKKIRTENQKNPLLKLAVNKWHDNFYKSIVVLANPKTVLNARYAKKEIRNQVIRADQLIEYIKSDNQKSKEVKSSDKEMRIIAERLLAYHTENTVDYLKKYEPYRLGREDCEIEQGEPLPDEQDNLKSKLKEYRLHKSRSEQIKPYYLFNDAQMADLISKMPRTKDELLNVNGFGPVKVEKYGDEILEIVKSGGLGK